MKKTIKFKTELELKRKKNGISFIKFEFENEVSE